jgi:three-Cys-motif partner protein
MTQHTTEGTSQEFDQLTLFPVEDNPGPVASGVRVGSSPLWTDSKAALITAYLRRFVLVTRHGTYIDGFAGRQRPGAGWAAEKVVEIALLRHFFLCDRKPRQIRELGALRSAHPKLDIRVIPGDFNQTVGRILEAGVVDNHEACFCLLDQRTVECHWATVSALAKHKTGAHKIEIFYFLANAWLPRALSKLGPTRGVSWWGGDGWQQMSMLHPINRAELMARRFREEFGYRYATYWPIHDRRNGPRTMYFMIHAADHPRAPKLMEAAYRDAVGPVSAAEVLTLPMTGLPESRFLVREVETGI